MKTVLLNLLPSGNYGRGVLRGIAAYVRSHTPWILRNLVSDDPCADGHPQSYIEGVIAHITRPQQVVRLRQVFGSHTPIVDVGNVCRVPGIPAVHADEQEVGRMAADHFLERGFRNLASYTYPVGLLSADRESAFLRRAREAGATFHRYEWPHDRPYRRHPLMLDPGLKTWLSSLPKPVGLLAANDSLAFEIMETCQLAGIHVPEDVAVLGVDNNTEVCDLATPPLSSIELDTDRIGFAAAALLDRLMSRRSVRASVVVIPPVRVITRQSTDIVAVADSRLAAAIRFVRAHAHEGIKVRDILRSVPMARRSLEERFRRSIGRTPLEEIRRIRIETAKDLLTRTDLPVEQVAEQSGFKDVKRMYAVFQSHVGMSPGRWRRQFRLGRTPPPSRRRAATAPSRRGKKARR